MRDGLGLHTHYGFNARVVLGDQTDEDTDDAAEHHGVHNAHFDIDKAALDGTVATEPEETGTDERGVAKGDGWVVAVLQDGHREHTDDGGDVADEAEENGHHHVVDIPAVRGAGDDHGGDDGTDEGLEDVRTHAGHVTNVVADVVSDDTGVAGVVLRNACFDFADEVSTDVSGLGVDATTDTSEQGNGGGTHTEASSCGEVSTTFSVKPEGDEGNAEEAKTTDGEAHDGAAVVGYGQGTCSALGLGGHGGSTVGRGSSTHTREARQHGSHSTEEEGDGRVGVVDDEQQPADGHTEDGEDTVFRKEERHGALLDFVRDLSDHVVVNLHFVHLLVEHKRNHQTKGACGC